MSFRLMELKNGKQGGLKKLVVLALEKVTDGVVRAYARQIESSSSKEFLPFFESYISKDAKIITDKWRGYIPLKKEYLRLEQIESKDGLGGFIIILVKNNNKGIWMNTMLDTIEATMWG